MTHASFTMDFFLEFLGRHLYYGNAPMREFVDEPGATGAGDLGRFRLGDLALRVPEQGCCKTHFVHELRRRQAKSRECPFRERRRLQLACGCSRKKATASRPMAVEVLLQLLPRVKTAIQSWIVLDP